MFTKLNEANIKTFKIKPKDNSVISIIMSKEFKCGSKVFIDDDDHTEELFIEKTFLCISNGNWIREFETGKLNIPRLNFKFSLINISRVFCNFIFQIIIVRNRYLPLERS